jgi:hypothetical protein
METGDLPHGNKRNFRLSMRETRWTDAPRRTSLHVVLIWQFSRIPRVFIFPDFLGMA